MKKGTLQLLVTITGITLACAATMNQMKTETQLFYDIPVTSIDGTNYTMDDYRGKMILIVNTASECGFTDQYSGLQTLYETYQDQGLVVLGVPSNNFLFQEPGNNTTIQSFCSTQFGVTFPLLEKTAVKGRHIHPLYQFLTKKETNPNYAGKVTWNFNKFLIGRDGSVINRFDSRIGPTNPQLIAVLDAQLN